ncbi:mCG145432, partial [Mus musculus]
PFPSHPGHGRHRRSQRDACPTAPPPGQSSRQPKRDTTSPRKPRLGTSFLGHQKLILPRPLERQKGVQKSLRLPLTAPPPAQTTSL